MTLLRLYRHTLGLELARHLPAEKGGRENAPLRLAGRICTSKARVALALHFRDGEIIIAMNLSPRLQVAIAAVRLGASEIHKFSLHRGDLKIAYKDNNSLVTNADIAAETATLAELRKCYPQDGILSEELGVEGDQSSCWVLDPLDGTTNFVHGLPEYAVSLAWCKDGVPKIGVVYDICRNEMYYAEERSGAFCDQRRIRVSTTRSMKDALIASTGGSGAGSWRWKLLEQATRQSRGCRRLGSGTLDLVLTARGCFDAAISANLHYWDYAAGGLILQEAGGVISDLQGNNRIAFGKRLGVCFYGNARIAGHLRRLAVKYAGEHDSS